jgi:predicted nucleic acid-binding protein
MNTLNFLDCNVWLALLWSRHIHSERARSWFEQAGQEQFFFCRFTQITVLRLLTTEQIMGVRSRMPSRSPKVWADAYMLAFTAVAGLKLITFDRALKSRGNDVLVL